MSVYFLYIYRGFKKGAFNMGTNMPRVQAKAGERIDHLISRARKAGANLQAECAKFFDVDGDLFISAEEAKMMNASSWAKTGENISLFTQLKNGKILKNTITNDMDQYTTKLRHDGKKVLLQDVADDKEHSYHYYGSQAVYDMFYSPEGKNKVVRELGCADVTKEIHIKTNKGFMVQGYDKNGMVFSAEVNVEPNKYTTTLRYGEIWYNNGDKEHSNFIGQGPKEKDEE